MRKFAVSAAFLIAAGFFPHRLAAQLVPETTPSSSKPQASAQTSPSSQTPSGKRRLSQEIQLTGDQLWSDTGVNVQAGEHVVVTATGTLRYSDAPDDNGPEGRTRGFSDLIRILPFNDAGRGALLGLIGDTATSQPFLFGAHRDVVAPIPGRLSVGINQSKNDTATGTYSVHIEVYAPDGGAARIVARQVASLPGIDNSLFTKIPRRITDKAGNLGDMVNFLILGSEPAMQRVFTTAGWVKVDADVSGTVVRGILDSLSKESYLTMPMSQLCLFGRFQDYGWAHAEPISVVASRNHLRIWKAGFQVNGQTLWAGAATHDIGFERDQRNNGVTHKIDPNIDLERDYVEKTLASTGYVTDITHFLPENPLKEARTATGGTFNSNGQVLVLKLDETSLDRSAASGISAGPNQSGCPVLPVVTAQSNPVVPGNSLAQKSAPIPASAAVAPSPAATALAAPATPAYSGQQPATAITGGGLQILRADYGIDKRFANVTSRLASRVQGNSLSLRVTNETMGGDPAEDHSKTLSVWYSFNGRVANAVVNEKDTLNLPAENDFLSGSLRIMRAQYGTGNRYADVTDLLNSRIQGDALSLRVTNETMGGDPDPEKRKQLIVFYIFNGRQARTTVNEKDSLTLPGNDVSNAGSPGDRLEILQASYGTAERNRDVTKLLGSQIHGNSLQLVVSNAAMGGDPAEGQKKRLRVIYLWQGLRYQTTLAEGETLSIP